MICVYCDEPAQGNFSIHRDGFGIGPEVALCDACGSTPTPTTGEIWTKIAKGPLVVRTVEEANALLIDPHEPKRRKTMYRENDKPKTPMTKSDLQHEIEQMQRDWDAAWADFKKKADPLEVRERRLVDAFNENEANEEEYDGERLGFHQWSCDKCNEESDDGGKTQPPLGWLAFQITEPVELKITLCTGCVAEKRV